METELQKKLDARMEAAFNLALEAIAMGSSYRDTQTAIRNMFPFPAEVIDDLMSDALSDAQAQGVERDEIDGSWLRR